MSISRLNYTGRKRIPRERIQIGITGSPPEALVSASFQLGDLGFPSIARVVLEAQAGWTVQRFAFGTIGGSVAPTDSRLTEFHSLAGLLFRLKVIAAGAEDGQLLGVADRLRPSGDFEKAAQKSFVVLRPHDLGDRIWKLDFDESQPLLLVNSRLGEHQDFLKRREVAALVLPEVLQDILVHAVDAGDDEESSGGWTGTALRLGERLAGRSTPTPDDDEEVKRWVDEAVAAFAWRHHLLDAFVAESAGSGQ